MVFERGAALFSRAGTAARSTVFKADFSGHENRERGLLSHPYGIRTVRTVIPGTLFEAAKTAFNAVISLKNFCLLFGTFFKVEGGTKVKISDFCVCCNFLCITAHCKSIFQK